MYLHGMGSSIHQHEIGPMYYMVYGRGSSIYYNGMGPMYQHGMGPMHQHGMGPMHQHRMGNISEPKYMYRMESTWNGTGLYTSMK